MFGFYYEGKLEYLFMGLYTYFAKDATARGQTEYNELIEMDANNTWKMTYTVIGKEEKAD